MNAFGAFLLFYPITMALFWVIGSLFYYLIIERKLKWKQQMTSEEGITFLVPCYNEAETIEETIRNLQSLSYPKKEIIIINDGSSDQTSAVIKKLKTQYTFQFIDLTVNQGKAQALNTAVKSARYNYIMCIDADTIMDDDAPYYMIKHLIDDSTLGAVTGNPRIRNKSSLLAKIQTVEYASMIGSIKRAQTMNGYVNTISGVFTLFNKQALEDVGFWDIDMITEDIAVSWKFHTAGYGIRYEPRALCWMLVPETLSGLWKQRVRWAQGGHEVLLRDFKKVVSTFNFPLWFLYFEQVLSIIWVYSTLFILVASLLSFNFLDYYYYEYHFSIFILSAFLMTVTNLVQFSIAMLIDSRYEKHHWSYLFFLSWYPTFYWLINAVVVVFALPKALKRKKGVFATWTSPDRGSIQWSNQD
ncbi:poly-beta-1,6 N-acetyl-D-glucosamine synthase [Macrococcus equipercicus]|uniref:Poly-beta-1,6-N-acetyl-D-glucosamine synthase n=1 Tax=Macrococcus equipercicus TaxID=69967 RepID=A0A9Q9F2L8_9STAP|nr:poly-beta-1,6-N-acetyl-D-glucosamine synthase [Macrococcus equipercicus]UTH14920.1 poly-beta-1,6 N-acetyl-D-glucosamine synthase [Macrococcus equipercicus]